MDFNSKEIKEIAGSLVIEDRLRNNKQYEWLDIVGIPSRSQELKDFLYFTTHSQGEGGWDEGFDRRPIARQVAKDKAWDLVTDGIENLPEENFLLVKSLEDLV